jgi:hypothetical protein
VRIRGEAVNALKRSIYIGRVSTYQAKQHEEMQAVADALSLLANFNLRGVFTFPIEQYRDQLLPSLPGAKSRAFAAK